MSIASKIALSALLVGFTLPALAQGAAQAVQPAPVVKQETSHATLVQKAATTTDATKATPAVKPAAAKTETVKTSVNTGIVKPMVPTGSKQPVTKVN